jgi:hypothetical protein
VLTDNFIEVVLDDDVTAGRGELVSVRVTHATMDETRGVAAGRPAWHAAHGGAESVGGPYWSR